MPDKNEHITNSRRIVLGLYMGMYAGAHGLGGAALVAIGANIRGHNVYNEMMTLFVGGAIIGSVNGMIRSFFPMANHSKGHVNIALCMLELVLCYNTYYNSPLLGEMVMNLGTELKQTLDNEVLGANVVLAGYVGANIGSRAYKYTSGFFDQRKNNPLKAEPSPACGRGNLRPD